MAGNRSFDPEEQGNIMNVATLSKEPPATAGGPTTSPMTPTNYTSQDNKIPPSQK